MSDMTKYRYYLWRKQLHNMTKFKQDKFETLLIIDQFYFILRHVVELSCKYNVR